MEHFEHRWLDEGVHWLDEVWSLTLTLVRRSESLGTFEVPFVRSGDDVFINYVSFDSYLISHGANHVTITTAIPVSIGGSESSNLAMEIVIANAQDSVYPAILSAYQAKYGSGGNPGLARLKARNEPVRTVVRQVADKGATGKRMEEEGL